MIKLLPAWLKKLFGDFHAAYVAYILTGVLTGSYTLSEDIRNAINNALLSETPLWISIALAVIVMIYTYLKARSFQIPAKKKAKASFVTTGAMKWKVLVYDDGRYTIDQTPYCIKHDMKFVDGPMEKRCPFIGDDDCFSYLKDKDFHGIFSLADRIVESKVRNGEKLC